MKIYVDLHIHSALSPCGDNDMTPNNIVNMAKLKGLDAIAITDHNSCENAKVCIDLGKEIDLLVIPGMELQTREDIHVVCLFRNIEAAYDFQNFVYSKLPPIKNNEAVLGEQLVFDKNDEVIKHSSKLFLTAADISFDEAFNKVIELKGVFIPAHIDRDSFSVIASLGFIPEYLNIKTLEYKSEKKLDFYKKAGFISEDYKFIKSSDAHYLENILEQDYLLEVEEISVDAILNALKDK